MRQVNPETGMIDFSAFPPDRFRQTRAKPGEIDAAIRRGIEATTDECVIWPFSVSRVHGYAMVERPIRSVHRIVCIAAHGPAPEDKPLALHGCGNRPCINARHLRWGNAKENFDDMMGHGRAPPM